MLPTVLIEIPNSNAIIFCVMPRAIRSRVAHSRAVSGRAWDFGGRLTPAFPVAHAATRPPTGAAAWPGGFGVDPGQRPPPEAKRAAERVACLALAATKGAKTRSRHAVRDGCEVFETLNQDVGHDRAAPGQTPVGTALENLFARTRARYCEKICQSIGTTCTHVCPGER